MRIACGLLLLMGTACATKVGAPPPSSPSQLHGEPIPIPRGQLVQGSEINDAAMEGKVVVVKFFAEYCRPCQRTLPEAARLANQYADTLFVGIAVDDSEIAVARQIRRFALPFTVLHDTSNASVGRFRVAELPATYVADSDGEIVWVGGPEQPDGALARVLAALNAGTTPPGPP